MLRQLKVPFYRKALIAVLLCSGLFVITAAIIRAAVTLGSSPSSITINRWGVRETIIGLLSINAPILRPLLTRSFWTGVSVIETTANAPADAPGENAPGRRRKHMFGSKSTRSDTGSSGTPKKLSKSDSAAFGVDTNVPGYSVNSSSQENMVGRDEEEAIELAPLPERHSEEAGARLPPADGIALQPLENVVYVERSYAVRTSDAERHSMAATDEQWRAIAQRTRTDISAVLGPSPQGPAPAPRTVK
ncbi:hypothetical protein SLS58_005205 [Diplodia intermedia]|uniref:Integral membrane protein n=1 Tax=Diplodia intermedia TaxID=856260 RepID=A0ABR3TRS2_9PEZI